jgi:hypothetical protein
MVPDLWDTLYKPTFHCRIAPMQSQIYTVAFHKISNSVGSNVLFVKNLKQHPPLLLKTMHKKLYTITGTAVNETNIKTH